jgi:galactonate dehydratase
VKITNIETYTVSAGWKNWLFIKVCTDKSICGIGEATINGFIKTTETAVHELAHFAIGKDPRQVNAIAHTIISTIQDAGHIHRLVMAAVEVACWDILGKSLGAPLWKLLGGKQRPRLRVYANGWYQGARDPVFFADAALKLKAMGYTALKFDPFGSAYRFLDAAEEKLSLDIVRAVRKAVGDDVDLCIEGHDRFSVSTAIRIGQQLEEVRPMWFETPVMSTDIAATVAVARAIKVPVATGERFGRLAEVIDLVSQRAVDIVQVETLHIGGISGARKAAAIAEAGEAFIALHQAQSPLNTAINAHIHASIPNFLIQECFDDFLIPWAHEIMHGVPRVKDGYLEPSDAPGLGVELDEAEMEKHPYGKDYFIRLFEDGWEMRRR